MRLSTIQRWSLYLFFFSINFEVWDPLNTNGYFSVAKLTGILYLISILPSINNFIKVQNIKKFILLAWLFSTLLTIVSLVNINTYSSRFFSLTLFQNIFLFWFLINHERMEAGILDRGLFSFAVGSISVALFYYSGIGIEYNYGRVSIFGDNENIVGLRMAISIIILLSIIIQNTLNIKKVRFLLLLPMPIMLTLMAETGSRVAFLSLALSFLAGVFLIRTTSFRKKLVVILIALIIGFLGWHYVGESEILKGRFLQSINEGDLSSRDAIWKSIMPLIKENSIFGVGETGYHKFTIQKFGRNISPHNVLLEVLAYSGVVGLFIYLTFLTGLALNSFRYYNDTSLLLQILLFVPILGLLLSGQLLFVKIGWIIFAVSGSKVFYLNSEKEPTS